MNLLAQLLTKNLKVEFKNNETEVYSDVVNLWRGKLSVGGKLFLTNQRLIFLPHNFNLGFGGENEYINLSEINTAMEIKTMKIIDNGLKITLINKEEFEFVVNEREQWIKKLKQSNIDFEQKS